jgi:hypothetical protein
MRKGHELMNEVGKPIDEIEAWDYQEQWRHYTDTDEDASKSSEEDKNSIEPDNESSEEGTDDWKNDKESLCDTTDSEETNSANLYLYRKGYPIHKVIRDS